MSATVPLKILIVGDSGTGKTCYVKRLTHQVFSDETRANQECDLVSTRVKLDEGTDVPIQLFNISGAQHGKTKIAEYFKNIDGCIIMFDVTRAETYDNILGWKRNVEDANKSKKFPSILIANKCDLEKDSGVSHEMDGIDAYCQAFGYCAHFEVSSKENINVEQSIQKLIREIIPIVPKPMLITKREYTFKILVIGEPGIGKTAVIHRYANNTFSGNYRSTVGTDLVVKKLQYNNLTTITLHFWDIAGQERFGSMTHLFYRNAAGCLIVFDVSQPSTLMNGAVKWKQDFDAKVNFDPVKPVPCLLLGNKCDQPKEGVIASPTHMTEFCQTHNFVRWFETSAKDNINIKESILFLVEEMMNNVDGNRDTRRTRPSETVTLNSTPSQKKSKNCCN